MPGVPQVYYVGLFADGNDMALLQRTGEGRDINRRYYSREDVQRNLSRPVVQRLLSLLRTRNTHPAFRGTFTVTCPAADHFSMQWRTDAEWATLDVNLAEMHGSVSCSPTAAASVTTTLLA
jgi:sucrose phosphorylase